MSEDLETRRRRALWRARHRGTKELDLVIGGFAEAHLSQMDARQLTDFEALLVHHEPILQRWLLEPTTPLDIAPELCQVVTEIRQFHGLDEKDGRDVD